MNFESIMSVLEGYLQAHGPITVGIVVFFESFGAPLPGETMLVLSGALAARGELSLTGLLFWAWIGAIAGDSVGYLIGRKLGRGLLIRYGSRVGLTPERYAKVEEVFARYGPIAVAFARFFNFLRQLNGLVAGAAGMAWPRFLMFNAIGATLWVGFWCIGAWYFADHASSFAAFYRHVGLVGVAAIVACVVIAVGLVVWLARRSRPSVTEEKAVS